MGFFSGITKSLFGGSESSGSSNTQSGFALLPPEIQKAYTDYANQITGQFKGGASEDMFTPLSQTPYETNALNIINRGTTPDATQLNSDITMQMNPFNDYVINGINEQAAGDYSVLKGALNEAGQFGSNRQMLGANDIENTRLNLIGQFKQDQYNQALNNSLTTLADSRARDAGLGFTAGEFLRGMDTQTKQAPINALTSYGQLLGVLPTSGGSTSTENRSTSESNGMFKDAASLGSSIAGIASLFSDKRLKENIVYYDTKNGYKRYKFNYKWDNTPLIGVIAQEIAEVKPEAIFMKGGYYGVDYAQLGFPMEVAE